jgi:hypothetical protein
MACENCDILEDEMQELKDTIDDQADEIEDLKEIIYNIRAETDKI